MKRLAAIILVFGALLLFGSAAVFADHGNTTAEIDPNKPPVTIVFTDPEGLASIFVLPAGGGGFFIDFFCVGPITESEIQFNPNSFPLSLTVTDCEGDTSEFSVAHASDTEAPVITVIGDATSTLLQGAPYVEQGATVADNSGEDLSGALVIDSSAVDTSTPGSYGVTYDVADSSGNAAVQVIRIVDVLSPQEAVQKVVDDLQDLVDDNPGTPLADKVEDALAKAQTAVEELEKMPPDNQAAMGAIEGAEGDLEAAIGIDPTQDAALLDLMDQLAGIARQIAVNAIADAISCDPGNSNIIDAQQSLADGDVDRNADGFKDAVAKYKGALAKAEGVCT